MHFSKTYTQLLSTLPPELRNNAFEYRKLKQLINQTVHELDSFGLSPSVLQSLHQLRNNPDGLVCSERLAAYVSYRHATVTYEIACNSSVPEPRLRLSPISPSQDVPHSSAQPIYHVDLLIPEQLLDRITTALLGLPTVPDVCVDSYASALLSSSSDHFPELIIPLPSDTAFFQLLASTLSSLSSHFDRLLDGFHSALATLAASISLTARPASSSAPHAFSAYSPTADNVMTLHPLQPGGSNSDLYAWREIFRLYAEAQVFDSVRESTQGERSIEDVERQLDLFKQLVQDKRASLVISASRYALDTFLNLNVFILDVKRFQFANSEATRKILKKHAKRTTLPTPCYLLERETLASIASKSLPRLLVQAVGEVLLPIIPHIDDYACLICTYIAFRPIRLCCGHFFCVRCLVKLQRRAKSDCPLCRAPTVLQANPSNIDYGLLNFIADWFPIESQEKLRVNKQEVSREQLEDLSIADVRSCRIM